MWIHKQLLCWTTYQLQYMCGAWLWMSTVINKLALWQESTSIHPSIAIWQNAGLRYENLLRQRVVTSCLLHEAVATGFSQILRKHGYNYQSRTTEWSQFSKWCWSWLLLSSAALPLISSCRLDPLRSMLIMLFCWLQLLLQTWLGLSFIWVTRPSPSLLLLPHLTTGEI